MMKREGSIEIGASEEPCKTEQGKVRVKAEDDSEARPRKRSANTKASEIKSGKKQKSKKQRSKKTGSKTTKNENTSQTKQSEFNSDSRRFSPQDSQENQNYNADTESQTQLAIISEPEDQNDQDLKEKMDFLDLVRIPRSIGEYAAFWRTSPFQHTLSFINCVNEMENIEQELKISLVRAAEYRDEQIRQNQMARKFRATAKSARLSDEAISRQNSADLQHIREVNELLEKTLREEYAKDL